MSTATIIGRGPSLLKLSAEDTGMGPVIVLNAAIERVRTWGLHPPENEIYSLQKDGCIAEPLPGETVILSKQLSRHCWPDHPNRIVTDLRDWGLAVNAMSVVMAVCMAHRLGCTEARMLAFDSYTHRDSRLVVGDKIVEAPRDYYYAAKRAQRYADDLGVKLEWIP